MTNKQQNNLMSLYADKEPNWCNVDYNYDHFVEHIIRAAQLSNFCIIIHNKDKIDHIINLPDCWSVSNFKECNEYELFGEDVGKHYENLRLQSLSENARKASLLLFQDRQFEFACEPLSTNSAPNTIITSIIEKTAEFQQQKVMQTLLREVSHRSKNMLAIVQSLASQTAKHCKDLPNFLEKFRGRIYSISGSQDLITVSGWQGARFYQLAAAQLNQYFENKNTVLSITGDDIVFDPNEALHLGLGFHELVVNSITFGALNSNESTILLSSTFDKNEDQIKIKWHETLPSKKMQYNQNSIVRVDPQNRFGSNLLEHVLPMAVGGEAEYKIEEDQILYQLTFKRKIS